MRALLSHRAMVQLCVLGFVLFFACYGQFESGLAAYGTEAAGMQPSTLGIALAANTAVIVVAQFVVLRLVERRRRSRVIASVGLIWAFAWIVAGYAGLGHGSQTMATAAMISTYALFGLGESMLSPTVAPLVADLAPESMVGQYNSAFALCKQLALAVGPAVGGPMGATLHGPYIVTFVLFSLGITVLALRLGRMAHPRTGPAFAGDGAVQGGGRVTAGCRFRLRTRRLRTCRRSLSGRALSPAGPFSVRQGEFAPDRLAAARCAHAAAPGRGDRRDDRDAAARFVRRVGPAAARQVVVAVGHLDDQAPVGSPQPQPHRRGAVLEGVRDELMRRPVRPGRRARPGTATR